MKLKALVILLFATQVYGSDFEVLRCGKISVFSDENVQGQFTLKTDNSKKLTTISSYEDEKSYGYKNETMEIIINRGQFMDLPSNQVRASVFNKTKKDSKPIKAMCEKF